MTAAGSELYVGDSAVAGNHQQHAYFALDAANAGLFRVKKMLSQLSLRVALLQIGRASCMERVYL